MSRHQCKAVMIMKNQANMTPSKEAKKASVTTPKKWRSTNDLTKKSTFKEAQWDTREH